ncbi:heavy-metal-associated domain-containing protein [Pseudomonas zhanjiangensis]|uniref:Heavy-metal-associated domain-containing protein n=1 Tax=Pseudomonas zhanjiangensis TaxID=3239015 RepID=A0ABV3YZ23_9PSED
MRQALIVPLLALPLMVLAAPVQTVTLEVQNMTCPVCPITVKKALEKVAGVSHVQIQIEQQTASVTYDPDQVQPEALIEATAHAGYPASLQK